MMKRRFDMVVKIYARPEDILFDQPPLLVQPVGIVHARDEWGARDRAMHAFFKLKPEYPLHGQFVDYVVREVPNDYYTLDEPAYLVPSDDPHPENPDTMLMVCETCANQSPIAERVEPSGYAQPPVCDGCKRTLKHIVTPCDETPLWVREFGFGYAVPAVILHEPEVEDLSWHNDVCPSFGLRGTCGGDEPDVRLWVEHPDRDQREANTPRYMVTHQNTTGDPDLTGGTRYEGDDLVVALRVWRRVSREARTS
jgi:hypothetical protein